MSADKKPESQAQRPSVKQPTRELTHAELINEIKAAHRKTQEKARL